MNSMSMERAYGICKNLKIENQENQLAFNTILNWVGKRHSTLKSYSHTPEREQVIAETLKLVEAMPNIQELRKKYIAILPDTIKQGIESRSKKDDFTVWKHVICYVMRKEESKISLLEIAYTTYSINHATALNSVNTVESNLEAIKRGVKHNTFAKLIHSTLQMYQNLLNEARSKSDGT